MNHNKSKQPKKVYRLAVYGLSASGKTCVLAALAMSRDPHPLQYSCTQIPASKKSSQALQAGQEWIEKATADLLQQKVPKANSLGEEDFTLEYDFIGTHQTFRIELQDYTGELIDIDLASSEELAQLAKKLQNQFAEKDGILVLAEAPYWDMLGHLQGSQKTRCAPKFASVT